MIKRLFAIVCLCLAAVGSAAEPVQRKGPLADLPSTPGPHVEKIKDLGNNQWLELDTPTADPKWGQARGRSWSSRMAYAPELEGAFLVGQGKHGYIKPDGLFDDIFFYDLNGNRWICLFPGINTKTLVEDIKDGKFKVNDDGQLADSDGQPLFTGYCSHSYQTHTYALDLHRWVSVGGWNGSIDDQHLRDKEWHKESARLYEEKMKDKKNRAKGMPFFYNALTGKLERPPFDRPMAGFGTTDRVVEYLPGKKALWLFESQTNTTWLGDFEKRIWTKVETKGPTPKGIDFGSCYDSNRDRIYVCGGSYRGPYAKGEGKVYVYDVKTDTWSNLPDKGDVPGNFASNYACVHYNSGSDQMVVIVFAQDNRQGVFAFDPDTGAWEKESLPLPEKLKKARGCGHGFYSPAVNAHFLYKADDSDDRGTMWVYRYKDAR
jgi:hypothetical protein